MMNRVADERRRGARTDNGVAVLQRDVLIAIAALKSVEIDRRHLGLVACRHR